MTTKSQPRLIPMAFHMHAATAITSPNTQIMMWDTCISLSDCAFGLKYVLYTSKVKMEDTAMSSEEELDVTAINRVSNKAVAPGFPSSATAAYGADNPEDISSAVILLGYVGKAGSSVSATAARPSVAAKPNGIANQAIPPLEIESSDQHGRCSGRTAKLFFSDSEVKSSPLAA